MLYGCMCWYVVYWCMLCVWLPYYPYPICDLLMLSQWSSLCARNMQYPCASGRGHNQQFTDVDYGRLLGVIKKEGMLLFKEEGRTFSVCFSSIPLPLTPPNTRTPYDFIDFDHPEKYATPGRKFTVYNQLLYFYTNHYDVHLPVPVATDVLPPSLANSKKTASPASQEACLPDHLSCSSAVATYDDLLLWACGPDLSTLGIACLTSPLNPSQKEGSFLSWAQCHSPLPFTSVQSLSMPGRVRHIQAQKIRGRGIVCVRSDYHLCLLQVSDSKLEVVRVHQTQHCITLSALSPYLCEECLVLTEGGELSLVSRSNVTPITTHTMDPPSALCFGAHPRLAVAASGSTLCKVDWRSATISATVLHECKEKVTCLSHDPSDPFMIAVATPSHFMLIDTRQSSQPVISVQLNFLNPPTYITSHGTTENRLVMLVSVNECMVLGVSKDPPHRATIFPHLVTDLRTVYNRLIVAGLPCEGHLCHVAYRLKRPIVGATLWHTESIHTAVIITDLGDVFYQNWTYEATPTSRAVALSTNSFHGYNLWIDEAFAQEKLSGNKLMVMGRSLLRHRNVPVDSRELGRYKEMGLIGDALFRKCLSQEMAMEYILSVEAPSTHLCVRCYYVTRNYIPHIDPTQHPSSLATMDDQCTFCGSQFMPCEPNYKQSKSPMVSVASAMTNLRDYCTPSEPANNLDHTLMSTWDD